MQRVVSLFLPTWSTDRVRRKAGDAAPPVEAPLVLVGREGNRRVVMATDAAALAAGIPCVAVRYGYNYGPAVDTLGAAAVVDSLAELL